jgi:hypothetical protein
MGDHALMLLGYCWAGADHEEGRRVLQPLLDATKPDVFIQDPVRWVDWQSATDSILGPGVRAYWKNAFLESLTDQVIDVLVEVAGAQTWVGTGTDLHHMGGAFGRVAEDATPFPNRAANYWLNIYGFWGDASDDERDIAWVRRLHAAVGPLGMGGAYVNAVAPDGGTSCGHHGRC